MRRPPRAIIAALLVLSPLSALSARSTEAPRQAQPQASDLAARLQARYQTVRDFTARFTQTYESGFLKMKGNEPERGEIKLKKPSRFRMTYTAPERKEFVADGETLKSYFPEDRVGEEHPLPEPGESSTALLFIAGRGDITRDFTAALGPDQPPGEWRLTLTPKTPQADYTTLTLMVERTTLRLLGFGWVEDTGGRSMIRFSDLRENTGIPDSTFAFQFPKGTIKRQ